MVLVCISFITNAQKNKTVKIKQEKIEAETKKPHANIPGYTMFNVGDFRMLVPATWQQAPDTNSQNSSSGTYQFFASKQIDGMFTENLNIIYNLNVDDMKLENEANRNTFLSGLETQLKEIFPSMINFKNNYNPRNNSLFFSYEVVDAQTEKEIIINQIVSSNINSNYTVTFSLNKPTTLETANVVAFIQNSIQVNR